MSSIASWSYANTATVKPFASRDDWEGGETYGAEYEIACTWEAKSEQMRSEGGKSGAQGAEFMSRHMIYTEDLRPKRLDLIRLGDSPEWEEIRDRTEWDMSPFNDVPDVKLVT